MSLKVKVLKFMRSYFVWLYFDLGIYFPTSILFPKQNPDLHGMLGFENSKFSVFLCQTIKHFKRQSQQI